MGSVLSRLNLAGLPARQVPKFKTQSNIYLIPILPMLNGSGSITKQTAT
jgi:hypothetical protein